MKHITFVIFYEVIEHIELLKNAFLEIGYTVTTYPLFKYKNDEFERIDNYTDHFIEFLNGNKTDYVLWLFLDYDVLTEAKNRIPNIINIFHNFDDPFNFNKSLIDQLKTVDIVTLPFDQNKELYGLYLKNVYSLFPAYDDKMYFPIVDPALLDKSFEYDVSIILPKIINKIHPEYAYINNIVIDMKQNVSSTKVGHTNICVTA